MKSRRTTVLSAVAFAAAVSLCGCASAPVAAPPTGSPSPAASPSASSLAPTAPATSLSASSSAGGLVVFDGCSLVMDTGLDEAGMMPAQTMALLPAGLEGINLGVPGQTTGMMQADAEDQVDPLAAGRRRPVLVVWEGTNDLVYGTEPPLDASAAYRHLAAYCRARQRAGYRVVVLTVLPRGGSAGFEAARSALNEKLRAGWAGFADALADVAADPAIGDAGAESDQTYYRDTVHLTPAGYGVVARRVAEEVRTLL